MRLHRRTLFAVCLIVLLFSLRLQPASAPPTALAQGDPPGPRPLSLTDAPFTLFLPLVEKYPEFVYLPLLSTPRPGYDWLQFNGDPQHSGNNTAETLITPANVASLQLLFRVPLSAISDGVPVYLAAVGTPGGIKDLVFLSTKTGDIAALDALLGAAV